MKKYRKCEIIVNYLSKNPCFVLIQLKSLFCLDTTKYKWYNFYVDHSKTIMPRNYKRYALMLFVYCRICGFNKFL